MALNKTFSNGQILDAADLNALVRTANNAEQQATQASASATAAQQAAEVVNNAVQNLPDGQAVSVQVQQNKQDLTLHTRLIGPYAKSIPVPLTADYASGKVLRVNASTGMVEAVTKSGWGVTRLSGASLAALNVSGGDTAFLNMGGKMESGIVIFAIETEVRNDSGEVIRRTLTSKYNAQNADVPVDGYLQTDYDLTADQNLLISHPLTTQEVIFMRSALAAKAATTQRNNLAQMAKLATKEGVFLQLIAGLAEGIWDTNPESGKSQEWLVGRPVLGVPDLTIDPKMANMDARSGDSKDIVVDKVVGGVVGGNQMRNNPIKIREAYDSENSPITGVSLFIIRVIDSDGGSVRLKFRYNGETLGSFDKYVIGDGFAGVIIPKKGGQTSINRFVIANGSPKTDIEVALDLTLLFPLDPTFVNSLGNNDASKVLTRLGIIALTND